MEVSPRTLAEKYLNDQGTPEERRAARAWLRTPEGQAFLAGQVDADLDRLAEGTFPLAEDVPTESMMAGIHAAVGRSAGASVRPLQPAGPLRPGRWYRWAAVWVGILLLASGYWLYDRSRTVRWQTGYGQTATVTLPDGSVVNLNGNSRLTYPSTWPADQPRRVRLEGEAFFSVVHTRSHQRFLVETSGPLTVEVLGTTFAVLKREDRTRVVLHTGKVRLNRVSGGRADTVVMQPGELVEFGPAENTFRKRYVNPDVYSSWKSSKLLFQNSSLREIVQLLEDTYGLEVEVTDLALLQLRFTGTIPNRNADTILRGLAELFDLKIAREGNRVVIRPGSR